MMQYNNIQIQVPLPPYEVCFIPNKVRYEIWCKYVRSQMNNTVPHTEYHLEYSLIPNERPYRVNMHLFKLLQNDK